MTDIYFNARGGTHTLRIVPVDTKPHDIVVFQALVDLKVYCYFEAPADAEAWELIELAVRAWNAEVRDAQTEALMKNVRWRD